MIKKRKACVGDMALKGIFKWGPGEQFGFIENELRRKTWGKGSAGKGLERVISRQPLILY